MVEAGSYSRGDEQSKGEYGASLRRAAAANAAEPAVTSRERRDGTAKGEERVESGGREIPALSAGQALALVRLTIGAMFIWVFFENMGKGLYTASGYANLIHHYINTSAAPALWKSVMAAAAANAAIAAPLQAFAEISFGIFLTLGLFTRPAALAACGFLASLWISELGTAWIWELLVSILATLALALGPSGRTWGLDNWLKQRFPRYPLA